jgi:uncharacterized protein (TIGR03792 family)
MVVEFLTFTVPEDELAEWLVAEAEHWTRFLERQPGFVRKERWRSVDDPTAVHAVIWWASMEQWKAIPQDELDSVVAAMGAHEREASCVAYDVLPLD